MKTKTINCGMLSLLTLFCVTVYGQNSNELPTQASNDWYRTATENLSQKEYVFKPTTKPSTYRTANPKNQLGFLVSPAGFSVHDLKQAGDNWNVEFTFKGIGNVNGLSVLPGDFTAKENKSALVFISPVLDIEYLNSADGLRQNFIVKQRPQGTGNLRIHMDLRTDLEAAIAGSGKLVFHTKGNKNNVKLIYDDLKVWDANGTILKAQFNLDQDGKMIDIVVDDNEAVYPVTVDPLNRTAEWSSSADGLLPGLLTNLQLQVQTLYGYTVAGLGDINGDGFDDVAITAPGMADVITGSGSLAGVGAVFIYLGSPTGLPAHPSKVLQPTTAVEGGRRRRAAPLAANAASPPGSATLVGSGTA